MFPLIAAVVALFAAQRAAAGIADVLKRLVNNKPPKTPLDPGTAPAKEIPFGNLHNNDYNIVYMDIRANAVARVAAVTR